MRLPSSSNTGRSCTLQATKAERTANDAEARFENDVLDYAKLAANELPKLAPTQLEGWRKALNELPASSGGRRADIDRTAP